MTTSNGQRYYRIYVSRGRGQSKVSTRWYVPDGWSQKAIDRELRKQEAEFERKVKAGEALTRKEKQAQEDAIAAEQAKIETLQQYAERVYMPSVAIRLSEHTRDSYHGNLTHWIYPALGNLKMPEITAAQIDALLLEMQAQGKAQATCVKVYNILNKIFTNAYKSDLIDRNPMDKVDRPAKRKEESPATDSEAFTVAEVMQILSALENEPLKWQVIIRLMLDTGMRRGECLALQWDAIDFAKNTITIDKNLCYTKDKGIYLDTPKNGKTRNVNVDPAIMDMLRRMLEEQTMVTRYVFTQDGTASPMHPDSPTHYLRQFGKRYGIANFHPHKLRHTYASIAITNGADIASVSQNLGHSDKAVTLRMYTHANEESQKQASDIFRNALKKAMDM